MRSMLNALSCSLVAFVTCLAVASEGQAQEAPYSPKKFSRAELIDGGSFQKVPFTLPWNLISTRLVSNQGREDFEQVYDERYDVVIGKLRDAYNEAQEIIEADGRALGNNQLTHLRVMGTAIEGQKSRFTLGQPALSQNIVIDVEPRGRQTVIIVRSTAVRMVYSGVMPARAPFAPAGAQPVPFRWN
jgi:hypothetical protein